MLKFYLYFFCFIRALFTWLSIIVGCSRFCHSQAFSKQKVWNKKCKNIYNRRWQASMFIKFVGQHNGTLFEFKGTRPTIDSTAEKLAGDEANYK